MVTGRDVPTYVYMQVVHVSVDDGGDQKGVPGLELEGVVSRSHGCWQLS